MSHQSLSNYKAYPVRDATILTNSYVAGIVLGDGVDINLETNDTLILLVDFTKGSLTSAEIHIEFSPDGVTWYQETLDSIASLGIVNELPVTRTFTATGLYHIILPEVMDKNIRISAHGTGTVTGSSMTVTALVGNH